MIADSGLAFSSSMTNFPNIFNGIPRGCMPSQFDFYTILNLICSPLLAYCLLIISQHFIAFWGMNRLLSDYFFKGKYPYHIAFLSLAFALLPYWPLGEFCVAGQPFVIWALLNLFHNKKTIYNWLIILLFPFCSSNFVFSNMFFLPGVLMAILFLFYRSKKWNLSVLVAWCILFVLSTLSLYHLFVLQFINKIVSVREMATTGELLNWKGFIRADLLLFLHGQYHFSSCQFPVIVVTLLISLFLIRSTEYYKTTGAIIALALLFCSLSMFYSLKTSEIIYKYFEELHSLQLRFITFLPMLWFLLFAISIYFILKKYGNLYWPLLFIIGVQIIFLSFNFNSRDFSGSIYAENAFYYTYFNSTDADHCSFTDYFTPNVFSRVKKDINYKQETVLCIGFASEVAQFNGFNTAASYLSYYPAEKKQELVAIFAPALKKIKNKNILTEVVASRRFQYTFTKDQENVLKSKFNIDIDTLALKKMDIKYVLSSNNIENHEAIHLQPIDTINGVKNMFISTLFVYKVK